MVLLCVMPCSRRSVGVAVVAHVRSGGRGFESPYAPKFLSDGDGIELIDDLRVTLRR